MPDRSGGVPTFGSVAARQVVQASKSVIAACFMLSLQIDRFKPAIISHAGHPAEAWSESSTRTAANTDEFTSLTMTLISTGVSCRSTPAAGSLVH
jgi:hypothetical protein